MRTPLAYCLAYPERAGQGGEPLNLLDVQALTFEAPDEVAFPTLGLAREAMAAADPGRALNLNAFNEVLNEAVRAGALSFGQLMPTLVDMMSRQTFSAIQTFDDLPDLDREARTKASEWLEACS